MAEDSAAHPDGYVVTPAELVQAAQHIARLADRVAGILHATVQPPAAAPDHDREPHPPGPYAEAEQDWRADGARALAALRADSHALAATGAAYLAADRDAAALLGRCGQPNQRGDRYDTPTTPGPDAPHRHPRAPAPGQVETGRLTGGTGLGPRGNPGGAMPGAFGDDRLPGWVQRAVTARVVVDLLQSDALALPHWRGDAADAYRDHLGGQLRVWQNLSEATAVADRLTDSGHSRDAPDAVEQRRSAQRRDGDELPTTLAAAERDDPATTGNGPAAGPPAPANPAGERARPDADVVAAPVRSASAQSPADTPEQARHTAPDPTSIPDPAARDGQPADRNSGDHAIADGSTAAGDAPVLLGLGTHILTATPAAAAAALPHYAHASAPTRTLDFVHRPPLTAPGRAG